MSVSQVPATIVQHPIADSDGRPTRIMQVWLNQVSAVANTAAAGFTGTIVTAKLTGGGQNGSITFTNGVVTGQTQAT